MIYLVDLGCHDYIGPFNNQADAKRYAERNHQAYQMMNTLPGYVDMRYVIKPRYHYQVPAIQYHVEWKDNRLVALRWWK